MLREQVHLNPDSLQFVKVKPFKLKAKQIEFEDVEFMSARDKQLVYKKWVSFVSGHFKYSSFSKRLYEHLHLHCGYIAHYNINGFYGTYFYEASALQKAAFGNDTPSSEYGGIHTQDQPSFGPEHEQSKRFFIDVYRDMFKPSGSDMGLKNFLANWRSRSGYAFSGPYGDLNAAMRDTLVEYMQAFENVILDANAELKKARRSEAVKLKEQQRKRLKQTIADAQKELAALEANLTATIKSAADSPKEADQPVLLNLFDLAS